MRQSDHLIYFLDRARLETWKTLYFIDLKSLNLTVGSNVRLKM